MRLLVTRPEPDASRSAERLRALGHEVLLAPLLRTETIEASFTGPFAAVLMTSANSARAIAAHPRVKELTARPAFTVGARSAAAARACGFAQVESADGALGDLVRLVAARFAGTRARLVYLAGEDRAGDLAAALAAHGIAVETAVVYRAVALDALPEPVVRELERLDGVLHYSARSACTFLRLAEAAGRVNAALGLAHYCLSEEVALPLRQQRAARIMVAARPDEAALIDLIAAPVKPQ